MAFVLAFYVKDLNILGLALGTSPPQILKDDCTCNFSILGERNPACQRLKTNDFRGKQQYWASWHLPSVL